jgi:hypothetical protein
MSSIGKGESGTHKALEVTLPYGSKITALPANPDTARGFSANVFLDEFAFHKDSQQIWRALFPVISKGWNIRVTSTPNGKGNKFYELATGPEDDVWSRHIVDIYQAVRDGLPRDIEELRSGLADEDSWSQEFELKWLDEASAWLSYDLISSCEDERAGDPDGYQGNVCFVGRDIGRREDLHVIYVWEQIGDVLWERERIEQKRATFAAMDEAFDDVMKRYRVGRACIDQTGMGEKVVEDAQRRYGSRVEGVLFTGPSKLIMATRGKERFEDRTVRIKMGDQKLRADLHKLRKVNSATGAPRFVAERDDDHADRTWAAFLGIHAAGGPEHEYDYQPAPAREEPLLRTTRRRRERLSHVVAAQPTWRLLMAQILDQYGRPIQKAAMTQQQGGPTVVGVRRPEGNHQAPGLTPPKLARILREAIDGDPERYLELAEDMEERNEHYAGVLGVRKRQVAGLEITVEAAGDDAESIKDADLVRDFIARETFEDELFDILDAVGKGFSATEIIWDTSEGQWTVAELKWNDPRWFRFDRNDGETLKLRGEAGDEDLWPAKWIVHRAKIKSGLTIRGGLARSAHGRTCSRPSTSPTGPSFARPMVSL